jgi:uncharacterized protein YbjT (DUF2867 family)
MRTVLVTAGSGSAGKACVEALLAKGFDVVTTARSPAPMRYNKSIAVRQYDANLGNDYARLFEGIDDLVLIGPPLDGRIPSKLAPLIDAAVANGVGHLVYLSGNYLSGMTGRTLETLPIRKVELLVDGSGLRHTIVRAGFFMDNYITGFYAPMVAQGTIALATGDGKSALIAGSDVGEFIAQSLIQQLTGEYIVSGPEALNHYEVAELLNRKLGRPIQYRPLSEEQLLAWYNSKELDDESIAYGLTLYRSYRDFATAAITDGFRQATGRDPITLAQFLSLA